MQESTPPTVLRPLPGAGGSLRRSDDGAGARPAKPKVKKLRLALVVFGLGILAVISTIFGMMMAVASELPALENNAEFRNAKNSTLIADDKSGTPIAKLTDNQNRILVGENEISPNIKNAVIAIEDRRFYEHKGVDYRGIARALVSDVFHRGSRQGASTITQQFV
jgi:penicillin-binding protein 1A